MPSCWKNLLEEAGRGVFARRSTLRLFLVLASGLVLAERGTVVAMAAGGGIAGQWRRACWFFAGAAWDADALGLAVARLIVKCLLPPGAPVVVAVDGTFFQRWGKKVFILSFHVSRGGDLRRPVVDSVADGTLAS